MITELNETNFADAVVAAAEISIVDNGIGSYEYWGIKGNDIKLEPEIQGQSEHEVDVTDFEYIPIKETVEIFVGQKGGCEIEVLFAKAEWRRMEAGKRLIATYEIII